MRRIKQVLSPMFAVAIVAPGLSLLGADAPRLCEAQDRPRISVTGTRPPHDIAEYGGVTPGAGHPPAERRIARRTRGRAARAVVATWPGFAMQPGGGSRFFLQLTQPVAPRIVTGTDRIEIVLPATTVHLTNSRRWLDTTHFETPVARARLERRGRDMVFVMYMRGGASPNMTTGVGEGGYHFVYVDFAPGHWRPEPAPIEPAPSGSVSIVRGGESPAPAPSTPSSAPSAAEQRRMDDERPPPASGPRP